jgi:hypothetical protein
VPLSLYRFPVVECALRIPVAIALGTDMVSRYARSYLVRSSSIEEAISLIKRDVETDGADVVMVNPPDLTGFGSVSPILLPRFVFGRTPSILWRSGRAFYPHDVA